jgi:predicted nucleic acid-binding protein
MEVVKGFHKAGQPATLDRFLNALQSSEVLVFDLAAAEIAGRIYGELERVGQLIGRADVMIAAIAINHNLTLVTGNLRHYERIRTVGYSELMLSNWREARG